MRLTRLDLLAYGPFRGISLDFGRRGLHVIVGRNEAGKSTTLRAITGLLYGIDARTPDAHVHEARDLRIGGVLESASGERLRVVRRKGNANTLLDESDKPIDEAHLRRLLAGISKETFATAYGLDHDSLAAGARAMLEGKGDLGESLFDASVGGGGEVQRLLGALVDEADRLYRPRATALPLNEAIKAAAAAAKTVKEVERLPEAVVDQEAAIARGHAERAAKVARKTELAAERARLERALRRLPVERKIAHARARLEALAVGAEVDRVLALKERHALHLRTTSEWRAAQADRARIAEQVADARRRAGVDVVDVRRDGLIQELLGKRSALADRVEQGMAAITKQARELARLPPPEPVTMDDALAVAVDRARALGDIEARVAKEAARTARARRDLEARSGFDGTLEAFAALRVPSLASVERLDARAETVARTVARLSERALDLERDARAIEKQLAAQAGDFAPPDAAALASARASRDAAWTAFRAGTGAPADVERLLREADHVADRMIREGDRVMQLARLRSEAAHVAAQRDEVAAGLASAKAEQAELAASLGELFAAAGFVPAGIPEAQEWLARRAQVVDAYRAVVEAEGELAFDRERIEEARAALGGGDSLAALTLAATKRLAALEEARRAAQEAEQTRGRIGKELGDKEAACERDQVALAEVTAKLGELLVPLGLGPEATAAEVTAVLEAVRELGAARARLAEVEARVRHAEAGVKAFEAEVLALGVPLEGLASLFERAAEAKTLAQEIVVAEGHLALEPDVDVSGEQDALERRRDELDAELEALEAEIGRLGHELARNELGLEGMRGESRAAEAAAIHQEALARVRDQAERWARVKLASVVLEREIARYRDEHQGPLLASASAMFGRLTLGAYAGIKAAFDDKDRPCLRCVRGSVEVDVAGLSDGTRDQLYLSLRLASLLRRAEFAEPMPLVLDDVLIQLDDHRAEAALGVLAEVAQRMQVLFFTHHARLVELARKAVPRDELVVHELSPVAPAVVTGA